MASHDIQGRTWVDSGAAYSDVDAWVASAPDTCFDYVAELSKHSEWAINRIEVTPLDPSERGVGARYRAVGHQAGKDWPADLEVTVYERPSRFEFTATGGPIGTPLDDPHRHTFTFTSEGEGTRLRLVRRDPLPPNWSRFKRSFAPVVVRLTLGIRKRTVANLRARLTADAT